MRKQSFTTDAKGWTWIFLNNKNPNLKNIDNPYQKDLERIATSFYVLNFPETLNAKGLWNACVTYGRIVDAFIANKRSKRGKRFGFIRFLGIKYARDFVRSLSNIWIGSFHLYVSVAHFQRGNASASQPTNIILVKDDNTKPKLNPNSSYREAPSNKPTFAAVIHNKPKPTETTHSPVTERTITLNDNNFINIEDSSTVLLLKLNKMESMSNMYTICKNRDGFDDLIKSTWSTLEAPNDGRILRSHDKSRYIEKKIDDGLASYSDRDKQIKLLQDIDKLDQLEALDLIQKDHIKWDVEGDENSKLFYGMINNKRRSQAITGILHEEVWISDPLLIKEAFLNYYKEKFQAYNSQVVFSLMIHSTSLTSLDRDSLETHFSLDEIKTPIWDCGSNKAPAPDGFSFSFIKKYWDIIKTDIFEFVNSFFVSGSMPQGANSSFLTLIPKTRNPISIKDFCPISLIVIHYKIISKGLANQLSKVIDKIIRGCLQYSRASILINGSPTSELSIKRGLRQKDPLSPFLFNLVMEGLHGSMSNAVNSDLIRGIKLGSSDITLSHLFYADDVVITFEWNSRDLDNIIRILHVFHLASGLKINIYISNIYGIGVSNDEVSSMTSRTGCAAGSFPFTYLGLPIGSNMNLTSSWNILVERFQKRLSSWKANLLSIGGRLTLIKAVLGSLGIYYLSIFKDPEWNWSRDDIGIRNMAYLRELLVEISQVDLNSEDDTCIWSMVDDGVFSIRSIRRVIDSKLLPSMLPATTWEKTLPRKVNIFIENVFGPVTSSAKPFGLWHRHSYDPVSFMQ
ncbi:putative RNA-directed DNA polymerase, eukaryota, reverse transcriptase zinc-binding domain protein [Tanacetum coccineum]